MFDLPVMSTIENIEQHETYLKIRWTNGKEGRYLYVWLRENIPEPHTVWLTDISKNRRLHLENLDLKVKPLSVENQGHSVYTTWPGDVTSTYSSEWLFKRNLDNSEIVNDRKTLYQLEDQIFWNANDMKNVVKFFDYETLFTNLECLHEFLAVLLKYGLAFVKNAQKEVGQLTKFIHHIGYQYTTAYGPTFYVKGNPNPTNQAYTSMPLAFHIDQPYLEYVPQVQALHCIRQAEHGCGGKSKFVDGLFVAECIRKEAPEYFKILSTVNVEYVDEGKDVVDFFNVNSRPVFKLDNEGKVKRVTVNDGMRSWFLNLSFEKQHDFYKALKYFYQQCNSTENTYNYLLNEGEMVFFDNLRVLHGRTAFEFESLQQTNEGRLLEGAYFNYDVVKSKIRILRKLLNWEESEKFISF